MILLSNTIGSAKESVAEVRQMASRRGGDGECDERVATIVICQRIGVNL